MDNYQHLYKGADGWEDWATTFERNSAVRRSVVIRDSVDGSGLDQVSSCLVQNPAIDFFLIIGSFANRSFIGAIAWASFYKELADMFFVGFEECRQ